MTERPPAAERRPVEPAESHDTEVVRIVSAHATDLALDWQKIRFALELGAVWALGASLCLLVAGNSGLWVFLGGFLGLLWTASCLQWLVGGVSRVVALELEGQPHSRQDAWGFVRAHPLGLVFGTWLVLASTAVLLLLAIVLVKYLAGIPAVGPTLGALLIVPVFLLVLAGLSVTANSYMMPCIMGVENVNVRRAVRYLLSLSKKPFQALRSFQEYVETVTSFLPVALVSGIFMAGGLALSLLVCSGDLGTFLLGPNDVVSGLVQGFSVGFILYSWIAYVAIYLACSFSMIYYNVSR